MATGTLMGGYWAAFNNPDGSVHTDSKGNAVYEKAAELQAVGLPINAESLYHSLGMGLSLPVMFDSITYPDGTQSLNNPEGISENAIRSDLNLDMRERYRDDPVYELPFKSLLGN